MEESKIALIDMDGTICDYVGSMLRELEKLKSSEEPDIDPFKTGDDPRFQYLWNRMDLIKSNRIGGQIFQDSS
ncbi:hypothetical protein CMO92_00010 [Candidatus Woesearchaeota archaeon]|nr:hypothetical protein [Candidatus Woesearchaeota archaeon]|tara:strand:+ start:282 stop:500 length:219 start_codon:yes stop_codon:yes gene_type:complete